MAAEGRAAVGACGFPQPSLLARPGKVSPALVFALAEVKERTVAGAQILPHPQRHWGRPAWDHLELKIMTVMNIIKLTLFMLSGQ